MGVFAAVLKGGSAVTWGEENAGGDCNKVKVAWIGVDQIYSTANSFTPVLEDRRVVTWSYEHATMSVIR